MATDRQPRWGAFVFGLAVAVFIAPLNNLVMMPLVRQWAVNLDDVTVTLAGLGLSSALIACAVLIGIAVVGRLRGA